VEDVAKLWTSGDYLAIHFVADCSFIPDRNSLTKFARPMASKESELRQRPPTVVGAGKTSESEADERNLTEAALEVGENICTGISTSCIVNVAGAHEVAGAAGLGQHGRHGRRHARGVAAKVGRQSIETINRIGRWRNYVVRLVFTFVMISGFCLIVRLGPLALMILVRYY